MLLFNESGCLWGTGIHSLNPRSAGLPCWVGVGGTASQRHVKAAKGQRSDSRRTGSDRVPGVADRASCLSVFSAPVVLRVLSLLLPLVICVCVC